MLKIKRLLEEIQLFQILGINFFFYMVLKFYKAS